MGDPALAAFLAYRRDYPHALADADLLAERIRLQAEIRDTKTKLDDIERGDDDDREDRHEDECDALHGLEVDLADVREEIARRRLAVASRNRDAP